MKTIIAGSNLSKEHYDVLDGLGITEVVCGGARGVDLDGKAWAESRGVPVKMFLPDWDKHGKSAGALRNREMAGYAEALVAFWDGKSRGTADVISRGRHLGLNVMVYQDGA